MIVTVTLNAALDVTYRVRAVAWNESNRVEQVTSRAGGKGVNVARVLTALGHEVTATGFLAGQAGLEIQADLRGELSGEEFCWLPGGESRRTLTLDERDTERTTLFNEQGPFITPRAWENLRARLRELAGRARALVCSGSLPPGLPTNAYAQLAGLTDVPVIIDSSGAALWQALSARPALVKPNRAELLETTGETDAQAGAEVLRAAGAEAVVVSLGADGLLACTADGSWRTAPPARVSGNPVGAGDAAVAALAAGLTECRPWPWRLRHAVAASAAAVCRPIAGEIDIGTYRRLIDEVRVEPV